MDRPILRLLIQEKVDDGRLPHTHIPRIWGGPGNGETCDGCGETVTKAETLMENLDAAGCGVTFHVACFYVWDIVRRMYEPRDRPSSLPSPASRAN